MILQKKGAAKPETGAKKGAAAAPEQKTDKKAGGKKGNFDQTH